MKSETRRIFCTAKIQEYTSREQSRKKARKQESKKGRKEEKTREEKAAGEERRGKDAKRLIWLPRVLGIPVVDVEAK